jgi:HEAT repeat protein
VLIRAVEDHDKNVGATAVWALGSIGRGSAPARKELVKLVAEHIDPYFRGEAAQALGSIGPFAKDALPALRRAVRDQDEAVAAQAVRAIAQIRDVECISEMETLSADKYRPRAVRDTAREAADYFTKLKKERQSKRKGVGQ